AFELRERSKRVNRGREIPWERPVFCAKERLGYVLATKPDFWASGGRDDDFRPAWIGAMLYRVQRGEGYV
ncbi:MAG: hypothetical protein ACYS21_15315, partial [Planctomycetota bacterium]